MGFDILFIIIPPIMAFTFFEVIVLLVQNGKLKAEFEAYREDSNYELNELRERLTSLTKCVADTRELANSKKTPEEVKSKHKNDNNFVSVKTETTNSGDFVLYKTFKNYKKEAKKVASKNGKRIDVVEISVRNLQEEVKVLREHIK